MCSCCCCQPSWMIWRIFCPLISWEIFQIFLPLNWSFQHLPHCWNCHDILPFKSWLLMLFLSFSFLLLLRKIVKSVHVHRIAISKRASIVIVARFLDSMIVVIFGSQVLVRQFKILIFSSPSSNVFPRPRRWFTMWVNLIWSYEMVSPFFIRNASYSDTRVCFLALLTSIVPSWVTSSIFQISFALLHLVVQKNSSKDKQEVRIFFFLLDSI